MVCHLDPYNLTKSIDGLTTVGGVAISSCNIMWCIPKFYMSTTGYTITMSNKQANCTGTDSQVSPAFVIDRTEHAYLAIGVYEATAGSSSTTLGSKSGVSPMASTKLEDFRTYAHNNTTTGDVKVSIVWNYYQYQLYRLCSLAVMENFDSQQQIGFGNVGYSESSSSGSSCSTGLLNSKGAYYANPEDTTQGAKLFIENEWGSLAEFIDDAYWNSGLYAGQNSIPNGTTDGTKYTSTTNDKTQTSVSVLDDGYGTHPYSTTIDSWGLPTAKVAVWATTAPDKSKTSESERAVIIGGQWSSEADAGLSRMRAASGAGGNAYGTRLAFLLDSDPTSPKAVTVNIDDSSHGTLTYLSASITSETFYITPGNTIAVSSNVLTLPDSSTITATNTITDWYFDKWDGITGSSLVVSADATITAKYCQAYTLSLSAGSNGSLSPSASSYLIDPNGSIVVSNNVLTFTPHGESSTPVTLTVSAGYRFADWSDGSSTKTSGTFNIGTGLTITAQYQETHVLTISNDSHGSISCSPTVADNKYTVDSTETPSASSNVVTFSHIPDINTGAKVQVIVTATDSVSKYHFSEWDGVSAGTTAVTAKFEIVEVSFSVNASHGSVSATGSVVTGGVARVPIGTAISSTNNAITLTNGTAVCTATATNLSGYRFLGWSGTIPGTISEPTEYTASFKQVWTITLGTDGHGTLSGTSYTVDDGTTFTPNISDHAGTLQFAYVTDATLGTTGTVTVNASGSTGYGLTSWGDTATLNSNRDITVLFEEYKVTFSAGAGGTVESEAWVPKDTVLSFSRNKASYTLDAVGKNNTATPSAGYRFLSWTSAGESSPFIDDTTVASEPVTKTITAPVEFTVAFKQVWTITLATDTFGDLTGSLSYTVDDGTVLSPSISSHVGTFSFRSITDTATGAMTDVEITATGHTGYGFTALDATTISSSTTVTAQFGEIKLTFASADATKGSVDPTEVWVSKGSTLVFDGNYVKSGGSTLATVTPVTGASSYRLSGWTGVTISSGTATVSVPSSITAEFVQIFSVTFTSDEGGTLESNGVAMGRSCTFTLDEGAAITYGDTSRTNDTVSFQCSDGTSVNVVIVADVGYYFDSWDSSPATATADITVNATMVSQTAEVINESELISALANPDITVVKAVRGISMTVGFSIPSGLQVMFSAGDNVLTEGTTITVPSGAQLTVKSGASLIASGTITNAGIISVERGSSLSFPTVSSLNDTGTVYNYGAIEFYADTSEKLIAALDEADRINGSALPTRSLGAPVDDSALGTITCHAVSSMSLARDVYVPLKTTLLVDSGSNLEIASGATMMVEGGAKVSVESSAKLTIGGKLDNYGTLGNSGTVDNSGFLVNNAGSSTVNDGTIVNQSTGKITILEVVSNNGSFLNEGGAISGRGSVTGRAILYSVDSIDLLEQAVEESYSAIEVVSDLTISQAMSIPDGGTITIKSDVTVIVASGAKLTILSGTTLVLEDGSKVVVKGSISGDGTISGDGQLIREQSQSTDDDDDWWEQYLARKKAEDEKNTTYVAIAAGAVAAFVAFLSFLYLRRS